MAGRGRRKDRVDRPGEPARLLVRPAFRGVGDRARGRRGPPDRGRSARRGGSDRAISSSFSQESVIGWSGPRPSGRPSGSQSTGRAARGRTLAHDLHIVSLRAPGEAWAIRSSVTRLEHRVSVRRSSMPRSSPMSVRSRARSSLRSNRFHPDRGVRSDDVARCVPSQQGRRAVASRRRRIRARPRSALVRRTARRNRPWLICESRSTRSTKPCMIC